MNYYYYYPVSFIYLWSWAFWCDRRSLWHGAKAGPTLGNDLFVCVCALTSEKFHIDWSEFLSTVTERCNLMICVTGELVRTPQSMVATFGKNTEVRSFCQSPEIELWIHSERPRRALYFNQGLDEGELDQCISQKLCDPVVTRWCGRNQNCWNQCSWFISDETKATPWFPWEGQSKTSGQGYNPPEHSFLRKDIYKQLLECITVFAQSWQRWGSHWQGVFWSLSFAAAGFPKWDSWPGPYLPKLWG